jgi:hypothetical protein
MLRAARGLAKMSLTCLILAGCGNAGLMQSHALTVDLGLTKSSSQDVAKGMYDLLEPRACHYLGPNAYDRFNHSHTFDDYKCRDGIYVVVSLEAKRVLVRVSQDDYFSLEADHLYSGILAGLQDKWPGAVKAAP